WSFCEPIALKLCKSNLAMGAEGRWERGRDPRRCVTEGSFSRSPCQQASKIKLAIHFAAVLLVTTVSQNLQFGRCINASCCC
uniref:Uncharacterized protein n=1 Tax=Callorhinchus milii TaxID=7868 RepID=A0A4W3JMP1_CALMI